VRPGQLWAGLAAWVLLAAPAGAQQAGCPDDGPALRYHNPRFDLAMTYPARFALDPDSIPASGDTARFATGDGQGTAVVTALRNGLGQGIGDLFREARQDVTENGGGVVTYQRARDNWFVLSGYMAGRIFYRRSLLSASGLIGTLWIEFPTAMKPCFEAAVTMMSLSFREAHR
jgi:hypothetical protein